MFDMLSSEGWWGWFLSFFCICALSNKTLKIFLKREKWKTKCGLLSLKRTLFVQVCVVLCLVTQSHLTLCNPMDCNPPGSCLSDSPGKNTGVGCHAFLQGSSSRGLPNPGIEPCLPCCRRILHHLIHQGSLFVQVSIT